MFSMAILQLLINVNTISTSMNAMVMEYAEQDEEGLDIDTLELMSCICSNMASAAKDLYEVKRGVKEDECKGPTK